MTLSALTERQTTSAGTVTAQDYRQGMASVAAAMDNETEMIFQIDGVLLMKKGEADELYAKEDGKKIIDFIREAKEADVEMRVCSAALQLHDMTEDDLIEECDGVVGAAYMTDVGLESDLVLNY